MIRSLLLALALAAVSLVPAAAQSRPDDQVQLRKLTFEFPAVGNFEAVRRWQLGRLQAIEQTAGPDLIFRIRTADERVLRIVGPAAPFADLAWQSNWLESSAKSQPGRSDYAERMIAFDVDRDGRLIAMASLEPVRRDRSRLLQALGG